LLSFIFSYVLTNNVTAFLVCIYPGVFVEITVFKFHVIIMEMSKLSAAVVLLLMILQQTHGQGKLNKCILMYQRNVLTGDFLIFICVQWHYQYHHRFSIVLFFYYYNVSKKKVRHGAILYYCIWIFVYAAVQWYFTELKLKLKLKLLAVVS